MGPVKTAARAISQKAFDEMVQENIDDLGMDPAEALEDAVQTLTLQGVDLSGIVTCLPGETNPVIDCLRKLEEVKGCTEIRELMDDLCLLCGNKDSGNAVIAAKNGAIELLISKCKKLWEESDRALASALSAMASVIHDVQSSNLFNEKDGPKLVVDILRKENEDVKVIDSCFSVVAAASTGNEVVKESFVELKIDEIVLRVLKQCSGGSIPSIYDAIRIILSADDYRVVASQVFGYARRFAKLGIAEVLVESLRGGVSSPCLVSASTALKALAVNDEICKSISNTKGVDVVLHCIEESGLQGNDSAGRACCSLLSKLAGSDDIKREIVELGGVEKLINLSARFSGNPLVLQEVMSVICTLCLRSPENAAHAIKSGAGDLAIEAMQKFPQSDQLQRNSCFMIRNLVARNPENRKLLLNNGIEELIRRAKQSHKSCKDAATDALRDLGVANYNL